MLYRNRRAPSGVQYWSLMRLSMWPAYAAAYTAGKREFVGRVLADAGLTFGRR